MTAAPDFGLVANHPALDFCNTVGEWADGRPERDKLTSHGHLVAWARAAGLLTPVEAAGLRRPRSAARLLGRARAFRVALYELVTAAIEGRQPDAHAVATVEAEVARAAEELLVGPLQRVRRCGGEGCGWLFRDTSRAGRRRWCSMSTCGNTAKVRRFRGSDR